MCNQCLETIATVFDGLHIGVQLQTPDNTRGRQFTVTQVNDDGIVITTQAGSQVPISRDAFYNALHYLHGNNHSQIAPCEIRSSNSRLTSGNLCLATRNVNNNVRCINYILPILAMFDLVGIYGARPRNTTWRI